MVKRLIGVVLVTLLLNGCMVEAISNSSLARNKDIDKAVEAYIAAGMHYLKDGDIGTAGRKFRKAYDLNPDSPDANNSLALFYSVDNEPEQVEKYYKKAIKARPDFSIARNNYASFLFDLQRYAEARDQLLEVTKDYNYSQRKQSLESLGYCYLRLNDDRNAEKYFLKALHRDARMGRSTLELAEIYFNRGSYPQAERYLANFDRLSAPNARHLWLAVRLQRILEDKNKLASFVLALKNIFPDSAEYKAYVESLLNLKPSSLKPSVVTQAPIKAAVPAPAQIIKPPAIEAAAPAPIQASTQTKKTAIRKAPKTK